MRVNRLLKTCDIVEELSERTARRAGQLRALARTADRRPSFPDYERALTSASVVIVPGLVLAEVDYFLRDERPAMRWAMPRCWPTPV